MKFLFLCSALLVSTALLPAALPTPLTLQPQQGAVLATAAAQYTAAVHILTPGQAQEHFDNGHWKTLLATEFGSLAFILGVLSLGGIVVHGATIGAQLKGYLDLHMIYAPIKITLTNTSSTPLKFPASCLIDAEGEPLRFIDVRSQLPWLFSRFIALPILATVLVGGTFLGCCLFDQHGERLPLTVLKAGLIGTVAGAHLCGLYSLMRKAVRQRRVNAVPELYSLTTHKKISLKNNQQSYVIPPHSTFTQYVYCQRKSVPQEIMLVAPIQ